MSFKEFTANIQSTRDYKEIPLEADVMAEIVDYISKINDEHGRNKDFYFTMLENGDEVYRNLAGIGGYSGIMIKSPHYIALNILQSDPENEFYGAYYMQSIVKKLYDMKLCSCWVNVRNIAAETKSKLMQDRNGSVYYLLAFGLADEKAVKQKTPQMTVTSETASYQQDPYGIKVNEAADSDKARHSLGEIVYLHEWGKPASLEELERRGMTDIFFYVRNAPSYKNLQPCRLILKDGETELALPQPEAVGSYTDAGIMMYTLAGLAKDLGIPEEWHFVKDQANHTEYRIIARIKL